MIVAILDNGVYLNHPDLVNKMFVFDGTLDPEIPAENPLNDIDDDGNGYVDDYWGWDAANPGDIAGCDPCDYQQSLHGTLEAGIIAAETNNGIGVASVSWGAKFLTVQMSEGPYQPETPIIMDALDYTVNCFNRYSHLGLGVDIISLDVAFEGIDYALRDKIIEVTTLPPAGPGILIVSPAGNKTGSWQEVGFPANYHSVVGVSGTRTGDYFWSGSCEGQRVDLSAPATQIESTATDYGELYGEVEGTSWAAPQVAGIAALCKEYFTSHPEEWAEVNMDTLRKALYVGAATWHPAEPFSEQFGIGRIDAYNAIKYREKPYYIIAKLWNPLDGGGYGSTQDFVEIWGTAMAKRLNYWQLLLDGEPDHPQLETYGPTNIEKLEAQLGRIFLEELDPGSHTLDLKVCRKLFGSGMMQGEGVAEPVPLCKHHIISFIRTPVGEQLIPELRPDNSITLDKDIFDYSINVLNPTSTLIAFKYQIDYRNEDSSCVLIGPTQTTLNPHSEFDPELLLTARFSPSDSSGNYVWNLRLFDESDVQIAVDSLLIVKE
jgi:subtilisin family serine protease